MNEYCRVHCVCTKTKRQKFSQKPTPFFRILSFLSLSFLQYVFRGAYEGKDGLCRLPYGMFEATNYKGKPMFKYENGEFQVDLDAIKNAGKIGIPFEKSRKIFYFQTTADPICAPDEKCAKVYAETLFGKTTIIIIKNG